jgi:PadR family transcriptional regulator, regulatory protein AphA
MLKQILLGFLNYKPMTGYELKTRMDESTAHFWHAYHSQIYTTLRKLEDDGLLSSEMLEEDGSPTKRLYTLTDKGRKDLLAWLGHSLTELPDVKEDLLVRFFFSARRDKEQVLDELRAQRQLHQQKLDYYMGLEAEQLLGELPPELERDGRFWQRTLEFGRRYESMYLAWLEETIQMLQSE